MNPVPWKNPRIVYTLLFVFLSGAVAGAVSASFSISREKHKTGPYWNEGGREISLQRFKKELKLDADQASQIERVLDDFVMYYQSAQAQLDDVRATGKSRILKLLREDQKQKFVQMLTDLQAKQIR